MQYGPSVPLKAERLCAQGKNYTHDSTQIPLRLLGWPSKSLLRDSMNIFGTAFRLNGWSLWPLHHSRNNLDVVVMETTGTIMEGTTWHEDERQNREYAEMGYYYMVWGRI